jgi:hypothetical protein
VQQAAWYVVIAVAMILSRGSSMTPTGARVNRPPPPLPFVMLGCALMCRRPCPFWVLCSTHQLSV